MPSQPRPVPRRHPAHHSTKLKNNNWPGASTLLEAVVIKRKEKIRRMSAYTTRIGGLMFCNASSPRRVNPFRGQRINILAFALPYLVVTRCRCFVISNCVLLASNPAILFRQRPFRASGAGLLCPGNLLGEENACMSVHTSLSLH